MRPNFIVLGPPRTATTWLFRCLDNHTQVFVPSVKETRFFDENFSRGEAWYEDLYSECDEKINAVGDITPGYFAHRETPKRIHDILGRNIVLFIIVRDPIERAYSHFNILRKNGKAGDSFKQDLEKGSPALESSLYAKHIKRYIETFGEQNICLLSHLELLNSPEQYWQKIQTRLGLEQQPAALVTQRVNPSVGNTKKNPLVVALTILKQKLEGYRTARRVLWLMRDAGLIKLWHKFSRSKTQTLVIDNDHRNDLYDQYFAADQEELKSFDHLFL